MLHILISFLFTSEISLLVLLMFQSTLPRMIELFRYPISHHHGHSKLHIGIFHLKASPHIAAHKTYFGTIQLFISISFLITQIIEIRASIIIYACISQKQGHCFLFSVQSFYHKEIFESKPHLYFTRPQYQMLLLSRIISSSFPLRVSLLNRNRRSYPCWKPTG